MWNAHNTVFGSKGSAICAQAVYFLHSTWINSQWWLVTCDWVISALSAVLSTCVARRRKFLEVSCTECIGQANDFEFIPTVTMETRNNVEGYFGSEIPPICNYCGDMAAWNRKTLNIFWKISAFFFEKNDSLRQFFQNSVPKVFIATPIDMKRSMSWNLAEEKWWNRALLTWQKFCLAFQLSLQRRWWPKSARASTR